MKASCVTSSSLNSNTPSLLNQLGPRAALSKNGTDQTECYKAVEVLTNEDGGTNYMAVVGSSF